MSGIMHFIDPETNETITINSFSKSFREKFKKYSLDSNNKILEIFTRNNIDLLNLYTDKPYINDLMKFFKNRKKRKK
jgi:hypothetical protein